MHDQGFTNKQAAEILSISVTAYSEWRRKQGLPVNEGNSFDISTRPVKERVLVRLFIRDLTRLCDQVNKIPDEEGITRFMNIWREKGGVA